MAFLLLLAAEGGKRRSWELEARARKLRNEALLSVEAMPLCPKNTKKRFEAEERCVARWSRRREAGRLEVRSFKDAYLALRLCWEGLLLIIPVEFEVTALGAGARSGDDSNSGGGTAGPLSPTSHGEQGAKLPSPLQAAGKGLDSIHRLALLPVVA